jgi:hypothetical protein
MREPVIWFRVYSAWTLTWVVLGLLTLIYGMARWADDPIGFTGSVYLLLVFIVQPAIWVVWWIVRQRHAIVAWQPFSRFNDWLHGREQGGF